MLLICTPTIEKGGTFMERSTPAVSVRGSLVEAVDRSFSLGGALTEKISVPVAVAGSVIEICARTVTIGGSSVFIISPDAAIAAIFTALAMNAKTSGAAVYTNFPMTSMFKLGLDYYGITADGLVQITGNTDNGANIDALIISGVSDLMVSERKNLPEAYLTMRCEGNLEFAVTYDERKKITKAGSSGKRGLSDIRFPLPLGADGNKVQIEIRNVDGADFDLKEAQIIVIKRDRRR
jgi:hypothetical protein